MGKNYTLYIRNASFEGEPNKSGLVNKLLDVHYGGAGKIGAEQPSAVGDKTVPVFDPKTESVRSMPALGEEKPCCKKSAPCQHWTWDGTKEVWKNTLSGRERVHEN